jgi:phospholipid/cholesterol/gamma-HCH transport system ATP-binding protein
MIEYRDVYKAFDVPVLSGVSFTVETGETLAVLGPSGTGKSVLLKTTIGLIVPDAGDVFIDGQSVFASGADQLQTIRRKAGYVFQNAALFDSMNVFENVAYGLPEGALKKLGRKEVTRRVSRSLEEVNLDPALVMSKLPAELSGGMRKRVGLARAIVGEPQILLYDEPVTGLDPVNAVAVDRLITDIAERTHVTSIVVTHDVEGRTRDLRPCLPARGRPSPFPGTPDEFRRSDDPLVRAFADRKAAVAAALAGSARSSRIADTKVPALP